MNRGCASSCSRGTRMFLERRAHGVSRRCLQAPSPGAVTNRGISSSAAAGRELSPVLPRPRVSRFSPSPYHTGCSALQHPLGTQESRAVPGEPRDTVTCGRAGRRAPLLCLGRSFLQLCAASCARPIFCDSPGAFQYKNCATLYIT